MPVSKPETQITWTGAATITLADGNWHESDPVLFDVSDWDGHVVVRAQNAGVPASGDIVEVRLLYTSGDLDAAAGPDDYPATVGANAPAATLGPTLDTYNNVNPDFVDFAVATGAKGFKLAVRAPQGATNNITIAARLITHRG